MCARFRGKLAMGMILACLALGGTLSQSALGQVPSQQNIKKLFTNKMNFCLPIQIAEEHRLNLKEMYLYVKGPFTDWTKQDTVQADAKKFTCHVPTDGEYWFAVVTVTQSGKVTPEDWSRVQPSLKVVVDTQPPLLDVRTWTDPDGFTYLKCMMIDANPDPSTIRLIGRTPANAEVSLDPIAGQPGLFRITSDIIPVRVTGKDLAQNESKQDVNFNQAAASQPTPFVPSAPPPPVINNFNQHPPSLEPQAPIVSTPSANTLPSPIATNDLSAPPRNIAVSSPPRDTLPHLPPPGALPIATPGPFGPTAGVQVDTLPRIQPSLASGNRKILNTTQATVEYRIDPVGASGIGKVEVYCTGDQGQTWKRLKEDINKRSPIEIELPGEGLFGISVVVTNGNGFGGTPPKRGDQPSYWIEVDMTSPYVELRPIDPNVASSGALEIRWTASDKNLAAEPVSLFYSTRADGVWQPIASGLKNDGVYRWAFPRGAGGQFFFKIEVVDQAGNVGRVVTPHAIVLDMTEPRGIITNVIGGIHRPTGQGN